MPLGFGHGNTQVYLVSVSFFLLGQVSSEAVAAPIVSEEGRGLSKKKKHRVSEPGALVIEHAELSDTGQSGTLRSGAYQ